MRTHLSAWVGIGLMSMMVVGCATASKDFSANLGPGAPTTVRTLVSITQLRFGDEAEYALCLEPTCPRTTGKTAQSPGQLAALLDRRPPSVDVLLPPERILVHFDRGSYQLSKTARTSLLTIVPDARAATTITLAGRTDSTGGGPHNLVLSTKRAIAVRDYLAGHLNGRTLRFEIDARANCCYIADNASEVGRSTNRRVEVSMDFSARQATR